MGQQQLARRHQREKRTTRMLAGKARSRLDLRIDGRRGGGCRYPVRVSGILEK